MSTTTTSSPTTTPDSSSTFNIYPFCIVGGILFLCIFQLVFSKWVCIRCLQPKRVTAETKRCCWDDGAYRKIEYHPGELEKIKEIGACTQFLHHLLFTSALMPTDDTFRAMSRHHRAACFWAVLVTPLLSVTLLMKNPSPLNLLTSSSSSSATTIINEDIFNIGSYDTLSLILILVCGVVSCFIGRFFWSLFSSAPRPVRLVPRTAMEKSSGERSNVEKQRDTRFMIAWGLWGFWIIGCSVICVVFGMKLPTSSSSPVLQHLLLSVVTTIVGFFVTDPIFCVILVCVFPKCGCAKDVSKRLVHPGLFSLSMGKSAIESPLLSLEYEGAMKLEDAKSKSKSSTHQKQQKKNASNVLPSSGASNSGKKNNNNNANKDDSDLEDETLRDRNPSEEDDNDIECEDEFPMDTATKEERDEYVASKLSTLDQWAELPPETSKENSQIRVVKRSEIAELKDEEERQRLQEEEAEAERQQRKKLEEIKNSGGLKAPKMNSDGTWSRPTFAGPGGVISRNQQQEQENEQKQQKENRNQADDDDGGDDDGRLPPSQKNNPLLCVVSKEPMTQKQLKQLQHTKALDSKIQSALSLANQVLNDADELESMAETRRQRKRQADLEKILGETTSPPKEDADKKKKSNYEPSTLGKSLAALLGGGGGGNQNSFSSPPPSGTSTSKSGNAKFGSHGLNQEEKSLWEQEMSERKYNNDEDCDDEAGGGGISLSQQVSILNSIGMDSIVTSPHYSKNKQNSGQPETKTILPSKSKEIDDFFFNSNANKKKDEELYGTTPSGARLQKQGAVQSGGMNNNLKTSSSTTYHDEFSLFDGDDGNTENRRRGVANNNSAQNQNHQNQQHALSPLSIRRMNYNRHTDTSPGSASSPHKTIDELGGLLDLPPPRDSTTQPEQEQQQESSSSPTTTALGSVLQNLSNQNKKMKKQKKDPLDTTSEDDDDEDDDDGMDAFFSLPRSSTNNRQQQHSSISIPASPSSTNSSSPFSSRGRFGRGPASTNNTNNSNRFFMEQEVEHQQQPPIYDQKQLGRNAFLPKVENDGEWRMVANPWEMI